MKRNRYIRMGVAALFALTVLTLPATAQTKKEKKARMERKVNEVLQTPCYKINVEHAYPQRGGGRSLTSSYSIEVRNDSLFSYLPYFGVAQRVPYGGGKGLIFDAPITQYTAEKDKKERVQIEFNVRNEEDSYTYHITLYSNGTANIDVQPTYKDLISFSGNLDTGDE